jgi:3-carboxy-cis,cis-muconate cycloisomerase
VIDLPDALFTTTQMAETFSGEARLQRMLDFEAALARAESRAGVIPDVAGADITEVCRAELFDVPALYREATVSGTPLIPLVRMLTELVPDRSRGFVHWGATSQDAIDTGMVLQVRDGLGRLIEGLVAVGEACALLAERHRDTAMPGRTWLQHALPVTFGLKAAHWLAMTSRRIRALQQVRSDISLVQLGGGAGTLASLGGDGTRVTELLGEEMGLAVPELPWHTDRDRIAEVVASLGIVAGSMAKIAGDVALLMQTEVAEAAQTGAGGRGGSSTMPQKKNPLDAALVSGAARLAFATVPVALSSMIAEHERALGGWQAEWSAVPDSFRFTAGGVERTRSIVAGLEVDPERMRSNLDVTGGQIMSEALMMTLAPHVGRDEAYRIVASAGERAVKEGRHLRDLVLADDGVRAVLDRAAVEGAFDPLQYLGCTHEFIDRALTGFRETVRNLD